MRKFIILFAEGSGEDQKLGRMIVTASGKTEAGKIFKEDHKSCMIEGILTEKQYQNIF